MHLTQLSVYNDHKYILIKKKLYCLCNQSIAVWSLQSSEIYLNWKIIIHYLSNPSIFGWRLQDTDISFNLKNNTYYCFSQSVNYRMPFIMIRNIFDFENSC